MQVSHLADEPFPDSEEPLSSLPVPLFPRSEGNEFHTQNASAQDWERHNIIERTGDAVHIYCELMDVQHGNLGGDADGDDQATLMVFRFRFDPQKQSRRVIRSRVKVEFFPAGKGGSAPEVEAMAPEERWSLMPTKDHVTTRTGSELSVGASQILEATGTASWSKTRTRDISGATTVTGALNLGTGQNSGAYTSAVWTLLENEQRKTGVPDSVRVALLLRREDDRPFNATVTLEADADVATSFGQFFRKVPLDDPILFNPKPEAKHPRSGRTHGALNLVGVDLYSLCDARMSSKAFWAGN